MGSNYSIFDNLLEGILVLDKDLHVIYINYVGARQLKKTRKELITNSIGDIYPSFERSEFNLTLLKCKNHQVECIFFSEFVFPDGTVNYFENCIKPYESGIVLYSIDITKQKMLEKEIQNIHENMDNLILERTKELIVKLEVEQNNSNSMAS
jgi:PAS domain-containing protein